jgi:uncharacterized protein
MQWKAEMDTNESTSMVFDVVAQCAHNLATIEAWLEKAKQYAESKKFDVAILLTARLAPDMGDFIYQVQSACDYAKAPAAWLSGQTPPKHEDNERTLDDLCARVRKTLAFIESVKAADYAGAGERAVSLSWRPGKIIVGRDYLMQVAVPNFYFHLTTAYAILRHNGVDVGKFDFLGPMNFVPA